MADPTSFGFQNVSWVQMAIKWGHLQDHEKITYTEGDKKEHFTISEIKARAFEALFAHLPKTGREAHQIKKYLTSQRLAYDSSPAINKDHQIAVLLDHLLEVLPYRENEIT